MYMCTYMFLSASFLFCASLCVIGQVQNAQYCCSMIVGQDTVRVVYDIVYSNLSVPNKDRC